MGKGFCQPGFRFHPTDEELVSFYLKRKVCGKPFQVEAISVVDLYKYSPWDLPEQSCLQNRDREWYFFCPRARMYAHGDRTKRATEIGFWKTTGKNRAVYHKSQTVGVKKTLVFYIGKAPQGDRTDWVMHEYWLKDEELANSGVVQDTYMLCRVFQKSGPGPRNGEQYGAPFREEDWNEEVAEGASILLPVANDTPHLPEAMNKHTLATTKRGPDCLLEHDPQQSCVSIIDEQLYSPTIPFPPLEDDEVFKMLLQLPDPDDGTLVFHENNNNMMSEAFTPHGNIAGDGEHVDGYEIYNGLEDIITDPDLVGIDKFYIQKKPEVETAMIELFKGIEDGCYLELNDLQQPLDDDASNLGIQGDIFASIANFENPSNSINQLIPSGDVVMPAPIRSNFHPMLFWESDIFGDQPAGCGCRD